MSNLYLFYSLLSPVYPQQTENCYCQLLLGLQAVTAY